MSANEAFDEEVYADEVEYEEDMYEDEEGMVEEAELDDSEGEMEEIGAEADDEDEQAGEGGAGAAGGPEGKGQMLYIPGIGYIPLSSLGGLPGFNLGGEKGAPQVAAPAPEIERDWKGLIEMPAVTQDTIADLTGALRDDGKQELTVLILGKGGVGKSSTVNSLLNERAANVLTFQQDNAKPTMFSRRTPDGFVLSLIDTPSLLDQDAVSDARIEAIGRSIREREIDAVLFIDRLDVYTVDAVDKALISGITRVLGPQIWSNTVLCLTRATEESAPPGVDFEDHVASREAALKAVIDAAGGVSGDVAVALVENSSRCAVNGDGEKIVPGEVPWVADVFEKVVDAALNVAPFEYRPAAAAKASDPNRRRKWLIPVVLAAQVLAKVLLDRLMDDDGCRGDANGPFDAQTQQERRDDLKEERSKAAKRRQREKQREAKPAAAPAADNYDDSPAFEEEEDDEWED